MKKLNTQTAIIFAVLALSSCDKGGGGNKNQDVSIPGVSQRSYGDANQSCNVGLNHYNCTENGRGATGDITFDSLATLCNLVRDNYRNNGIAQYARQQIEIQQCQNQYNNGYNNGINNGMNNGCGISAVMQNGMCIPGGQQNNINGQVSIAMRNFTCQLYVKNGDIVGDTGVMSVPAPATGGSATNMYTFITTQKKYLGGLFRLTKFSTSEKFGKVKLAFTPGDSMNADMIKLSAEKIDGETSASVTGYAGSEVKLEVGSQDDFSDATYVMVKCQSAEATKQAPVKNNTMYACQGTETEGSKSKVIKFSRLISELMGQTYSVTNTTNLSADGEFALNAGTASYVQSSKYGLDAMVMTSANITTPSAISVSRPGYNLNVTCKPIQ